MIAQPYQIYVERTDPSKNMARFYAMRIEPTLFGDVCLTRCWGRIGAHGQVKKHSFALETEAVALFLDLLREKRARGYRPKGKDRGDMDAGTGYCPASVGTTVATMEASSASKALRLMVS